MKTCSRCDEAKPVDEFHVRHRSRDGRQAWCKPCAKGNTQEWRSQNRDHCNEQYRDRWAVLDEAKKLAKHMWTRHRLTLDDLRVMWLLQGGRCDICRVATYGPKGMHVDHDHSCCGDRNSCDNCRRGLLCENCNWMVGQARDNAKTLQAGAEYLERFSG